MARYVYHIITVTVIYTDDTFCLVRLLMCIVLTCDDAFLSHIISLYMCKTRG